MNHKEIQAKQAKIDKAGGPKSAAERKAAQRARQKASGHKRVELNQEETETVLKALRHRRDLIEMATNIPKSLQDEWWDLNGEEFRDLGELIRKLK